MKIQILDLEPARADVAELLVTSPFKPWRCLEREQGAGLARFWIDSVTDRLVDDGSQGLIAVTGDAVAGLLICSTNPWETPLVGATAAVINDFVVAPHPAATDIAPTLLDHALQRAASRGIGFLLAIVCGRCRDHPGIRIAGFPSHRHAP